MAADPEKNRSQTRRYTAERGMPGSFEGETVSRRRFMNGTAQAAGLIAGAAITLPALGFALGPVFARPPAIWQDIGPLSRFTASDYTPVVITIERGLNVRQSAARSTSR
jgi:menaquinol-cytochrome c reductase iron-sulfur subunit